MFVGIAIPMFTKHIYLVYMSQPDLALNNIQWYTIKPN